MEKFGLPLVFLKIRVAPFPSKTKFSRESSNTPSAPKHLNTPCGNSSFEAPIFLQCSMAAFNAAAQSWFSSEKPKSAALTIVKFSGKTGCSTSKSAHPDGAGGSGPAYGLALSSNFSKLKFSSENLFGRPGNCAACANSCTDNRTAQKMEYFCIFFVLDIDGL